MNKKYLIEIPDTITGIAMFYTTKDGHTHIQERQLDSLMHLPVLDRVRTEAYQLGFSKGFNAGRAEFNEAYPACTQEEAEELLDDAHDYGMSDAWKLARRIEQMSPKELADCFGVYVTERLEIYQKFTVQEVAEKFKAYEEERL